MLASAYRGSINATATVADAARALVAAARGAGIRRIVVVGGSGILEVAPGVQLADTPGFSDILKPYRWRIRTRWMYFTKRATSIGMADPAPMSRVL